MTELCPFPCPFTHSRRQQKILVGFFFFQTVSAINLREVEKALKGISL